MRMCGKHKLLTGPGAEAAHTVLGGLCVSITPLRQRLRKLLQNGILMQITIHRMTILAKAMPRSPGNAVLAAMHGGLPLNLALSKALVALSAAVSVPKSI